LPAALIALGAARGALAGGSRSGRAAPGPLRSTRALARPMARPLSPLGRPHRGPRSPRRRSVAAAASPRPQNSNLVLTAEQRTSVGREPDGSAETLWGRMAGRMGDRAQATKPEGLTKPKKRRPGDTGDASDVPKRRRVSSAGGQGGAGRGVGGRGRGRGGASGAAAAAPHVPQRTRGRRHSQAGLAALHPEGCSPMATPASRPR
jgi:hypothetical protein